jgi:hypothetical protein
LLPAHAALGIGTVKVQLGALVELDAQLRGRPGEGSRLPQDDLAVRLGAGGREARQQGSAGTD